MTDSTPYTDDDVERLAAMMQTHPGHQAEEWQRHLARRLLAAGVTLPPEPDTPPEPQERYYVDQREVHRHLVFTGDSKIERLVAECFTSDDAELVGSLLNLEAKHEDQGGVGKAIEQADVRSRMRSAAMARMEAELDEARAEVERLTAEAKVLIGIVGERDRELRKVTELGETMKGFPPANEPAAPQGDGPTEPPHEFQGHPGDVCTSCDCQMETGNHLRPTEPLFTGHIGGHGWQSGRDEYVTVEAPAGPDARVHHSLGMEVAVFPLGHGPTNQPVTAEMVYEAIEAAGVRDGLDRGNGPAYIRPCDWTPRDTAAVAGALNVQLGWRP